MTEYRIAWKSTATGKEGHGSWQTDKGHCETAIALTERAGTNKEIEHWIEEREAH